MKSDLFYRFGRTAIIVLIACSMFNSVSAQVSDIGKSLINAKSAPMSAGDVYLLLLKNHVKINYEVGLNENDKKELIMSNGTFSVNTLLEKLHSTLGYDFERKDDRITIFTPSTRNLGDKYPLNVFIPHLRLENVDAYSAMQIMAKAIHAEIMCPTPPTKGEKNLLITLVLQNTSVRDALSQIAASAGYLGWQATAMVPESGSNKGHLFLMVNFN